MKQAVSRSSASLVALWVGVILSVATQCGPPDPREPGWLDTGWWDTGGGGGGTWDAGYTVDTDVAVRLEHVGDSVVHTVRVDLTENCLSAASGSAWTAPTGWAVLGTVLQADLDDTGADTDSGDTSADTDTAADTGGSSSGADARFHVTVVRSDGLTVLDDDFALYDDLVTRALASDLDAFASCDPEVACETTWRVEITLTEGAPVEGDLNVHSRIQMCSSGPGEERHISVALE